MNFLNDEKIYFVLHDCCFDSIEITSFGLILNFENGIYIADNNDDYKLSKECKLELYIDDLKGNEDCHISIIKFKKTRRIDVSFNEFLNLLRKGKFRVYLDFYSNFAKAIYIKGNIDNTEIEMIVTEIEDLLIKF